MLSAHFRGPHQKDVFSQWKSCFLSVENMFSFECIHKTASQFNKFATQFH